MAGRHMNGALAADPVHAPCAAVDVGTNSVRLLVVDADGQRLTRELTITRLGAGVDRTGHLDDAALARTLDTLARYRTVWTAHGATRVRIAATSAVRDAADRDRFFEGVRRVTGTDAEVLTGDEEAALSFAGAATAVEVQAGPVAVVDIGGGSTEIVVGEPGGQAIAGVSRQLGCVRLSERHLHHDPPTPSEIDAAQRLVAAELDGAVAALTDAGAPTDVEALVAVAGTATTLAALHAGLDAYEEERIHGTRVPVPALDDLTALLLAMTAGERSRLGPMQPGREDVIHGGAMILAAVAARLGVDEVVVSESDGLDGLASSIVS